MKTNRLYKILIILLLTLTSCSVETLKISANDTITYRNLTISEYSAVEIANDFNAYITFSATEESIEIEANDNLQNHIIAKIEDNKLIVKLKNNINIKGSTTLNVYITTKSINNFKVAADSKIYLKNTLNEDNVTINVAADSFFSGKINIDNLELKAAADSKADLYGEIRYLNANLAADAKLLDYDLNVENLKINMAADCYANLTVNNTIDVTAAADCVLKYKGNATIVYQNLKADSKIIKIN